MSVALIEHRLFLLGDVEAFDLLSELAGRIGYVEVHRADDEGAPRLPLGPGDHVLVGHRDLRRVRTVISALLREGAAVPGYLGLCLSEKDALVALLKLSHERVPKARLDAIRAPAGHGAGASTPDEVAVAIAAELIAVRRGARGRAS